LAGKFKTTGHKVKLFYMRRQQQNNVTTFRLEGEQQGEIRRGDCRSSCLGRAPTPTRITPSNKCSNQL